MNTDCTPLQEGLRFPAEWKKHKSTWLSYPHNEESWPGKIDAIFPAYNRFIYELSLVEKVNINVDNEEQKSKIERQLLDLGTKMENICFWLFKTNDAWIRDHGPAFVTDGKGKKAVVDWNYNAWGGKYPFELDNEIPKKIAQELDLDVFSPNIVMEGGSIDVNGIGDLLTTRACLLNENRNPLLSRQQIEDKLHSYYGAENILWLQDGIEGDDTDGHVDDMTRFVNENTILTMVESDTNDSNHEILKTNRRLLSTMRSCNGKQFDVVEMEMPKPVYYEGQRLPASYANFYIANNKIILPLYKCEQDEKAVRLLEQVFKDRQIVGIDSTDIIWGLGSFHCLSQQEPEE